MKTLGRTNAGGYIVEMDQAEHKVLAELAGAEQGETEWSMSMKDVEFGIAGYNLSNALTAIRAYTVGKIIVNHMREHIDSLEQAMSKSEYGQPRKNS